MKRRCWGPCSALPSAQSLSSPFSLFTRCFGYRSTSYPSLPTLHFFHVHFHRLWGGGGSSFYIYICVLLFFYQIFTLASFVKGASVTHTPAHVTINLRLIQVDFPFGRIEPLQLQCEHRCCVRDHVAAEKQVELFCVWHLIKIQKCPSSY